MKAETKTKIKDWFIITRIRVLNFIKEHKYFSAGIGILLLATFISITIRATTDEPISDAVVVMEGKYQPELIVKTESDDNIAPNFSTITYTIGYYLTKGDYCATDNDVSYKSKEVEIKASLSNDNVKWGKSDETTISSISADGKVITIKVPLVNMCSKQTQNITLYVLNATKNMVINPNIEIKGGPDSVSQTITDTISVPTVTTSYEKEYSLEPLVRPGIAEKISNTQRDAIFGILLGFKSSDNITSLKGTHIQTSTDVILLASQQTNESDFEYLDIYTENLDTKKYFDKYTKNLYYFTEGNVPDLSSSSGNIKSLSKDDYDPSNIKLNTNKTPIVKMNAPKTEEYEQYPTSVNYVDSTMITDKDNNNFSGNIISRIYKGDSTNPITQIPLNEEGTYKIQYTVNGTNSSTTMVRTINVVKPQDKNNNYSLKGAKTIYVEKNGKYNAPGIYNRTTNSPVPESDYTIEYYLNNVKQNGLDTAKTGTYVEKYIISNATEESIKIERTVNVVEKLPSETSVEVSTTDSVISKGSNYVSQGLKINNEDKNCNSDNNCSYTPTTIDSSNVGEQIINYTINDNENILKVSKKVYITPQYYKLSIENIIPNSNYITKVNDDFYAIGSYYVTVKSIRKELDSDTHKVKLEAIVENLSSSAELDNKQYSDGFETSSFSNVMYVKENSEYIPVDSSNRSGLTGNYYTAAMGEEVKMLSRFEYGYDADDNISELDITIPVNGNLIPISYSTEVSNSNPYFYLKAMYHGEEVKGVPDTTIKYCLNDKTCIDPEDFDADKQVIEYINMVVKEVKASDNSFLIKPGTTIELGTKYKVRTFSYSDIYGVDFNYLKFNGDINFKWSNNNQELSKSVSTNYDIYITPYKARTLVGIGKNDNYSRGDEIVLDASKNDTYTIYASTNVISPAMNIRSNIFGYNTIPYIPIIIELPEGVNYVYNKEYDKEPYVSYGNGKTYLTYTYLNVEPNSWIEPIYIDFNIDVSIASDNPQIKVYTGDPNNNDMSLNNDVSSIDFFKIKTKTIVVQNTENVSYGQYFYSLDGKYISNIDKNSTFNFSTKLHNNATSVTNLTVYTILPYNDTEKESSFSGSFSVENLPESAYCTDDSPSSITKSDLVDNNVNWYECSRFRTSDGKYSNLTAYKVFYENLDFNANSETKITINTIGNKPDDSYTFKSYLSYITNDGVSSGYKNFKDVKLDVVSKKIMGVVWEDFNVDGIMDSTEKKLENVTLNLYDEYNQLIKTTTPNKDGKYTFSAVPEGNYYIVANFNTDKYGVTGSPSEDFYDRSRLSVFKEVPLNLENNEEDDIGKGEMNKSLSEKPNNSFDDQETLDKESMSIIKTDLIVVENESRIIRNINLGLSLRKKFEIKVDKYITRAEITNLFGIVTIKNYDNVKLAKLDVKDINNLKIKVVYTIEIKNVKYYPGYVKLVTEEIPDGMSFDPRYKENKDWILKDDRSLINTSLANDLLEENQSKYLTVAFDITRKEAGSFVNFVSVDELQILGGVTNEE